MSIADEPDIPTDLFWERVTARVSDCYILWMPGAPMLLILGDGREFVGGSKRELAEQVEAQA